MKTRLLFAALMCSLCFGAAALAQAPKADKKAGDKKGAETKAPAPKTPADLAFDQFNKARTEPGAKDQARFERVIAYGFAYLTQHPTHSRVNDAVRDLGFFGTLIDRKQTALRTSFASNLKLDVTNYRYKAGLSEPAQAAVAAVDAAVADFDLREAFSQDKLATLREKIDALAQLPGSGRFLVDRERSFAHVLMVGPNPPRAEAHLKTLLEHPEKPVATMAREELNIVEARKQPFELKFTALDGKEVDLAQLRGKVVGMLFWNTTSKTSTDRIEPLKQIYANYRKRGFEMVSVSYDKADDRAKLEKYIKDNRLAWPVYFDGKGAKNEFAPKINAIAAPRIYLFDQKGILQTTLAGTPVARVTPDFPTSQVEGRLKQLLGIK